jgi:hypothetical protein
MSTLTGRNDRRALVYGLGVGVCFAFWLIVGFCFYLWITS